MNSQYGSAPLMKISRILLACTFLIALAPTLRATPERTNANGDAINVPDVEVSTETAYLWGIIGNPNSYEIGAQFFTARWRWGMNDNEESIFRGYNQFYFLAMAEPIFRGPENHYFGINTGFRYNFARPGSRFTPYISGGVGMGFIDSHANIPGAQGQDFTFNILSAVGVSYQINDRWKANVGILYQHLSNAQQTDPNPSLNLLGPQIGVTYSF
jgi:opacity protein-like surface antigen